MKVLIVEDEIHVREALELLIDWNKYEIGELLSAENGEEALAILEEKKPEIMFCDMRMPRMDGAELLEIVKTREYNVKVIVISGYDDYRYTRAAIQAHGVDYILKPLKRREVQGAFDKAVTLCRNDLSRRLAEEESGKRIEEADRILSEQKLFKWLKGEKIHTQDVLRTFERLGLSDKNVCVDVILPRNAIHIVHQMYAGDNEMFAFELNNISREILSTYLYTHLFCIDNLQWILISSKSKSNADISADGHNQLIRRLAKAWENNLGLHVFAASGDTNIQIENVPEQIKVIRLKLLKCELLGTNAKPDLKDTAPRFIDQEMLISNAIREKNLTLLTEIIKLFCQKLKERNSLKLEELQIYTAEANLMIRRLASKLACPILQYGEPVSPWINNLELWQETLIDCFYKLMDGDGTKPEQQSIDMVRNYIHSHFNKKITLLQLSEQFFLSPQYISKSYRERFGKTVISDITGLRMENAKVLLANTGKPVLEIALSLGFDDENYFGKVFKKYTGISPNRYRTENLK